MERRLFKLLFLCFIFNTTISAQTVNAQRNDSFADHLRFGGGIGLSFGNNFFSGTLAPNVLYEVNPYFLTGVGLNMTYSSFNDNDLFVYGGSLIGIARPIDEIQLSLEFEQLRVNRNISTINGTIEDNYWYPALFLGIGYNSGPVTVGIRYDVLYNDNKSIYASAYMPFVRVMF